MIASYTSIVLVSIYFLYISISFEPALRMWCPKYVQTENLFVCLCSWKYIFLFSVFLCLSVGTYPPIKWINILLPYPSSQASLPRGYHLLQPQPISAPPTQSTFTDFFSRIWSYLLKQDPYLNWNIASLLLWTKIVLVFMINHRKWWGKVAWN